MATFRICGPKLAAVGTILSVWGIVQLSFMAIAFYQNSVAFVEDLKIAQCNATECSFQGEVDKMERAYAQQAENCGMAVLLYFVTLAVSLHQMWMNNIFNEGWF